MKRDSELNYRRILQQQYNSGKITKKELKKEKNDILNLIYINKRKKNDMNKEKKKYKLMLGDNMESLKKLPDNSVDSVVSDPPYGLSFMGKKWDYDVPSVEFWKEVYRVLKPGGHVLSFGGTRTYHRMVVNIEDAGFEIRDQVMWLYGSGFPKSHNIGIAIDKQNGIIGHRAKAFVVAGQGAQKDKDTGDDLPNPNTKIEPYKAQNDWEGFGTALKPANEPICVARKPLSEKSVAENVLKWGTGGINIDGCRVGTELISHGTSKMDIRGGKLGDFHTRPRIEVEDHITEGRFPANIILECCCDEVNESDKGDIHTNPNCPCYVMDGQSGVSKSNCKSGVKGGASRFFYQAKVSKKERNMGLDGFEDKIIEGRDKGQDERAVAFKKRPTPTKNTHPTLKPINLMTYLCRLVTPPNGIVLDPFMGSGSTGISAQLEGFRFIGMEMEEEYFRIAEARIENWEKYKEFKK